MARAATDNALPFQRAMWIGRRNCRSRQAGHLLECGAQVTSGYFAAPGVEDVPGVADPGFSIVEMQADGDFIVTERLTTVAAWTAAR
jgi:hypothetical protein